MGSNKHHSGHALLLALVLIVILSNTLLDDFYYGLYQSQLIQGLVLQTNAQTEARQKARSHIHSRRESAPFIRFSIQTNQGLVQILYRQAQPSAITFLQTAR